MLGRGDGEGSLGYYTEVKLEDEFVRAIRIRIAVM